MPYGVPVTNSQRAAIRQRRDEFPSVVARDLGLSTATVRKIQAELPARLS